MQKIYQFHKIIDFIVGFFILYISLFTNKCHSIIEYIGLFFLFLQLSIVVDLVIHLIMKLLQNIGIFIKENISFPR